MVQKFSRIILFSNIFLLLVFSILTSTISQAQDNQYTIEFVGKEYNFLKTVGNDNQKFNYYTITIKLKNTGFIESDDITLAIWEQNEGKQLATYRNSTIEPGETIEFTFGDDETDWIVSGTGEHTVMYEYCPTNTTRANNYNSGSGSFKINDGSLEEENTPGFQIIVILAALLAIILYRKKEN